MSNKITLQDIDKLLVAKKYSQESEGVEISLWAQIMKICSNHGLKYINDKNRNQLHFAVRILELIIEEEKNKNNT